MDSDGCLWMDGGTSGARVFPTFSCGGRQRQPLEGSPSINGVLDGLDKSSPARVAQGADVAHPAADVAETDLALRIGDPEATPGTGMAEGGRTEARHAGRGELVARAEADVRSGRAALDQGLSIVSAGTSIGCVLSALSEEHHSSKERDDVEGEWCHVPEDDGEDREQDHADDDDPSGPRREG